VNLTNGNNSDPNQWQQTFIEGLYIDYRHFDAADIPPRYEFGYGLSYTTFNVSSLNLTPSSSSPISASPVDLPTQPGGNPDLYTTVLTATASVTNTGPVPGKAVVQLYLALPSSAPAGTPVKVLRGFEKVALAVGETQTVSFALTRKDVSYWDVVSQEWLVPGGEMEVMVGTSSRDLPLSGSASLVS
jgi:beta-glucosidase